MATPSLDLAAVKQRQQEMWGTGDYSAVATQLAIVSELLCEAVDLHSDQRVLDVACGSGNTALAAARRFCDVVGVDYVPELLERGRERAVAERLPIEFQEGDAEALAFPDASFDVVLSTFGVMFAPDQARAASEMLRVCRPGGKIGLASWTPEGYTGQAFRLSAQYLPPPPGVTPPSLWGTEARLQELLGHGVSELRCERRQFVMRQRSPRHWIDYFRTHFGPSAQLYATLDQAGQERFTNDLLALIDRHNVARDGTMVVPAEYLEVVAVRA